MPKIKVKQIQADTDFSMKDELDVNYKIRDLADPQIGTDAVNLKTLRAYVVSGITSGITNLSDLGDVTYSNLSELDYLIYSGGTWINKPDITLSGSSYIYLGDWRISQMSGNLMIEKNNGGSWDYGGEFFIESSAYGTELLDDPGFDGGGYWLAGLGWSLGVSEVTSNSFFFGSSVESDSNITTSLLDYKVEVVVEPSATFGLEGLRVLLGTIETDINYQTITSVGTHVLTFTSVPITHTKFFLYDSSGNEFNGSVSSVSLKQIL